MRKYLTLGLATLLGLAANAQTFTEWQDPQVNAINRAPMHTDYFAYESSDAAQQGERTQSAYYMSLNGMWKFNWVKDADARPTGFWRADYNDKAWAEMPVPGVWELNGYGDPIYVNVGYPWREQYKNNPPQVPVENNHVGTYRRTITVGIRKPEVADTEYRAILTFDYENSDVVPGTKERQQYTIILKDETDWESMLVENEDEWNSYYAETFRKWLKITPSKMRKEWQKYS